MAPNPRSVWCSQQIFLLPYNFIALKNSVADHSIAGLGALCRYLAVLPPQRRLFQAFTWALAEGETSLNRAS